MRLPLRAAGLAVLTLAASPALAHEGHSGPAPYYGGYEGRSEYDPRGAQEAWLADCRQRLSSRDSGVGGAVIGGVVGGLAGNRIAGRGNRTAGTVVGAAVGAVAGAAIDKAEDRGRNRDECEAYLDDYYARYNGGGYGPGYAPQGYYPAYGYGYPAQGCCMAQPMMMVPVARPAEPNCTETVEYVYEDVPVRPARRVLPRRSKAVPDKRVKIVPDKRVLVK
ncbi:glycine zipper 2TM domain-containing protein [Novosphingobium kaempferiae]|uniref:glycine zipper 2TM domain-containing protein n=1 Tax=Novosphingobium kaempferiae TaxID=2896849 RepID=UPI001E4BA766|nr:glycine zipper 2TM domain-containing protein [Novosphingobium kaempferiae]